MHNRLVLPFKDVNYGASKTSATQNTAANPADLADGSVGIYGIHRTGSTNLNKWVLITDGGSETAGFVPMATFVGEQIFIAMGTANSVEISNPIDKPYGLKTAKAGVYAAPVKGIHKIGYNGSTGSLSLPGTIAYGQDFTIGVNNKNYFVSGERQPGVSELYSTQGRTGDTAYTLLKRWIADLNLRPEVNLIDRATVLLLNNGTGAVFTTSATVAAVNGATTLTTSAAHGVTAGDAISLGGDYYLTIAGTTGSTLVLDRPYQGATATIANAATLDLTVAPTQFGIQFTEKDFFMNTETFASGGWYTATRAKTTASSNGTGSYDEVALLETEARPKKGTEDFIFRYMPVSPLRAVSGATYDLYILEIKNSNHPNGDPGSVFRVLNYITLAFVSGVADTTNKNQSDFEDIMTSLFGATFPAIS